MERACLLIPSRTLGAETITSGHYCLVMASTYRNHLFFWLDNLVNKHWHMNSIPSTHIHVEQMLHACNPIISEVRHEDRTFLEFTGKLAWPTWISSGPVRNPDTNKKWKGHEK